MAGAQDVWWENEKAEYSLLGLGQGNWIVPLRSQVVGSGKIRMKLGSVYQTDEKLIPDGEGDSRWVLGHNSHT